MLQHVAVEEPVSSREGDRLMSNPSPCVTDRKFTSRRSSEQARTTKLLA